MTRVCGPCTRGDHDRCVGIACWCRQTPRCASNADLTSRNEHKAQGEAVA